MAKTVIVRLTDDIDGGDAEETVHFSLDGKSYEIDVNTQTLRRSDRPLSRSLIWDALAVRMESLAPLALLVDPVKRRFSRSLSSEEKERFRAWADMATARRISDSRVNGWIEAGKP